MQMYGEKFLELKIDGNKIIRISEFKKFNYDFLELINDLNNLITDDWETLQEKTIYVGMDDEWYSFDVDIILDWIGDIITEKQQDGEEKEDYEWLSKWIKPLEEAKGFTIYLTQSDKNIYNKRTTRK